MHVLNRIFPGLLLFIWIICISAGVTVLAGSLDDTGPPESSDSAMYTLEDIYNRLDTGAEGDKRTGPFTEPATGPTAGTGHTLDEVMDKAPAKDEDNGAVEADVVPGKTFWGLTEGEWGPRTGTMPTQTLSDETTQVDAGYYEETTLDAVDTDLASGNIRSGVRIFGVTGNVIRATGTAEAIHVLEGYTFSNAGGAGNGTMPDIGAETYTPGTADQTVAAGYHNGSGKVFDIGGEKGYQNGRCQWAPCC